MVTGTHGAHVNNVAQVGRNAGCVECHADTVSNDTTIATPANHLNKVRNLRIANQTGRNNFV